jgi:uncharacterized protein
MPPDSDAKYFIARIRDRDVAAVSLPVREAPPMAVWNTYVWVESADEAAGIVNEHGTINFNSLNARWDAPPCKT